MFNLKFIRGHVAEQSKVPALAWQAYTKVMSLYPKLGIIFALLFFGHVYDFESILRQRCCIKRLVLGEFAISPSVFE